MFQNPTARKVLGEDWSDWQEWRSRVSVSQRELINKEWGWSWNCESNSEPHSTAYAVLRIGRLWLGRYTKWSSLGLSSENIKADTPFHAIINCLDNCRGVRVEVPSGFFSSSCDAKDFVEYHSNILLQEAFKTSR